MIKQAIALSTLLISFITASAQDVIFKKNGTSEEVKIKEVSIKSITYKRWGNLDGPDFILPRGEIRSIRWENGEEEKFGRGDALHPVRTRTSASNIEYGKNIIALAPIWMTNTSPIGIGGSYERLILKENMIGLYLPFAYSMDNGSNNNVTSTMFWAYPGAKFYPTGNNGIARYGVGLSAAIGVGKYNNPQWVFDPTTQTQRFVDRTTNVTAFGPMITNSLNLQPSPHAYIGLELGLGIPYSVDNDESINFTNPYDDVLVQFHFKIGYRF